MAPSLLLLGAPRATVAGGIAELTLDKPASLLYYLARRGDWVGRSDLAFLYRPDAPEAVALANVRKFVFRARSLGWAGGLEVEKHRLRFRIDSDVDAFLEAAAAQDWPRAVRLYRGEFLSGLHVADAPAYETWLDLERQSLAATRREAVLAHVVDLVRARDFAAAEGWLEPLRRADPLDEEVLQATLRVLYGSGKRRQGREAFERFGRLLRDELDVEPLEATRALAEGLHAQDPGPVALPRVRHNLPAPTTRFVGRQRELAGLGATLAGDARLLTLVGLGGVGKTRLALELATRQRETFRDGVWFVPLAGVASADLLVSSIAGALGLSFSGALEPGAQLADFVREKELLLLLDNFEGLLDGAVLLDDLLAAAPRLRIVVTSRVALDLRAEWRFDVEGLAYPPAGTDEPLDGFDAVDLFVQRASQRSAGFVPRGEVLAAVAELSRRVEGMPLALELAASRVRGLSVPQVLAELDRTIDVLSGRDRDLPERQRRMRTVFDDAWGRLRPRERAALAKLSVFGGGFTLEAAKGVAEVGLEPLLSLIDRALVRRPDGPRYHLHELLRNYAHERLGASTPAAAALARRHAAYYADWLARLRPALRGPHHRDTLGAIGADLANVRLAWSWVTEARDAEEARKFPPTLFAYFDGRSLYREGIDFFQGAVRAFAGVGDVLGPVLARQGALAVRIGGYAEAQGLLRRALEVARASPATDEVVFSLLNLASATRALGDTASAEAMLAEGLALAESSGDDPARAAILNNLALYAFLRGQTPEGEALLQRSLELYRGLGDDAGVARTSRNLGNYTQAHDLAMSLIRESLESASALGDRHGVMMSLLNLGKKLQGAGDDAAARSLYREGLSISEDIGNRHGVALALNLLSETERALGDHAEAARLEEESLAIRRRIHDVHGMGYSLDHLGLIAYDRGQHARARELVEEGLALRRAANDRRLVATSLGHLGLIHARLGAHDAALAHLREARDIARELGDRSLSLETLFGLASLLAERGEAAAAAGLLADVVRFATDRGIRARAEARLAALAGGGPGAAARPDESYEAFERRADGLWPGPGGG